MDVSKVSLVLGLIVCFIACGSVSSRESSIPAVTPEVVIDFINSNDYLLVLLYGENCNRECDADVKELERVADTTFISGLKIVKNGGTLVAESYGVTLFPSLLFFRNGYPILLPARTIEANDVVVWMEQNRDVNTQVLTDTSFEHDTQASTGATTGDWFIMFYSKKCTRLSASWETLASELKHQMNVAKVDVGKNPRLASRFNIAKCPTLIFFRLGNMYRYDLPNYEYNNMIAFATGAYKNFNAEKVMAEPSPFDVLTSNVADAMKEHLEGPNGTYIIVGGVFAIFVVLLVGMLLCSRTDSRQKFD